MPFKETKGKDTCIDLLRSAVIKDLNRRLFHKLNNVICIAMTNLELLSLKKIQSDSKNFHETISETRQATRDFSALIENVSFFLKASDPDVGEHSFESVFNRVKGLISSGILTGIKLVHDDLKTLNFPGHMATDAFFLGLFLINRIINSKEKEVLLLLKREGNLLDITFRGTDIPDNIDQLSVSDPPLLKDINKHLFLIYLNHLDAGLSLEGKGNERCLKIKIPVRKVNNE